MRSQITESNKVESQSFKYTPAGRIDASSGITRYLYHPDKESFQGTPEQIARTYLSKHQPLFGISSGTRELSLKQVQQSPAGNHVRFHQLYNDIPVYGADVVVSINEKQEVTFVANNAFREITIQNTIPALSEKLAQENAISHLNIKGKILHITAPLLTIAKFGETFFLTYKTIISTNNPRGAWEIFVDAHSGEILSQRDIAIYEKNRKATKPSSLVNGTGYIYNPDPLTSSIHYYGQTGYTDSNDLATPQLNNARTLVTLQEITYRDNNYYLEGPYVKIDDWDTPNIPVPISANSDSFQYDRNNDDFEAVNIYFHLDSAQRYIQSLNFLTIQNLPISADPHGFDGADNSYYNPGNNGLSFGDGNVDDAEDADIIYHEYGHAIQNGIVSGWGGFEEGALGEGFGDYWAQSYSRTVNTTFSKNFLFTWDAGFDGTRGRVWPGRPTNEARSYPSEGVSGEEVHDAGQIWCSVLMLLWEDLGKEIMDPVVLQSHFYMSTSASMRDNAAAIIQADRDLYSGAHLETIIRRFLERNFISKISIFHTSLTDIEDTTFALPITATINDGFYPVDTSQVFVVWGRNGLFTDTTQMHVTKIDGEFECAIPAYNAGAEYRYYLIAKDTFGNLSSSPSNAPSEYYSFYAGKDTTKPRVRFSPLYNQTYFKLPTTITLKASDNIGIDSVFVEFSNTRTSYSGIIQIPNLSDSTYEVTLPIDTLNSKIGDSITYRLIVKDVATISNILTIPPVGYYQFKISGGNILLVRNDVASSAPVSSFQLFYSSLSQLPFTLDTIGWDNIATVQWANYDVMVFASGLNTIPLGNTVRQQQIITRINSGGKIWLEGGQVGYFYRKGGPFDSDPSFRRIALHDSTWLGNASSGNLGFGANVHSIFTTPELLANPIAFTDYSATADRDAMQIISNDPKISQAGEWSTNSGIGGIIFYNPIPNQPPSSIFFTFALSSITDTNEAKKLVKNGALQFFPRLNVTEIRENQSMIPEKFSLFQNYPNPFNPVTVIRYSLPANIHVSLKIYDILGKEVTTLVDEFQTFGSKAVHWDASNFSSGIYICRMSAGNFIISKKMLLIR